MLLAFIHPTICIYHLYFSLRLMLISQMYKRIFMSSLYHATLTHTHAEIFYYLFRTSVQRAVSLLALYVYMQSRFPFSIKFFSALLLKCNPHWGAAHDIDISQESLDEKYIEQWTLRKQYDYVDHLTRSSYIRVFIVDIS